MKGKQLPEESLRNISAISRIEREALQKRTAAERLSDAIAYWAGSQASLVAHAVFFGVWIALNSRLTGLKAFDPFPFSFLTLIVSLEAIFLSLFILMSQNRMARQADQRGHLDLQIDMLAEFETTKMLQMLQCVCTHLKLPIADDPEVQRLAQRTEPESLFKELTDRLPENSQ
jgi:uncharacterized membrane protein